MSVPTRILLSSATAVTTVVLLALGLAGCGWLGLPSVRGCWSTSADAASVAPGPLLQRLVVLGDFGASYEQRNSTLARALHQFLQATPEAKAVTHVLLLGDNFYPRGLVGVQGHCDPSHATPAAIEHQLEAVLEPFAFLRELRIPVTAIPGNHDHGCGTFGLENQANPDRFLPPHKRWGSLWNFRYGEPQAVLFSTARLRLLLLDSEPMVQDGNSLRASAEALERLITEEPGHYRWQLVAAHHPLRTLGEHDGAFPAGIRKPLTFVLFPVHFLAAGGLPPFSALSQEAYSFRYQRYRRTIERIWKHHPGAVDLFLAGHDHSLQLLAPQEGGFPTELVVGSGAYCSPVRADPKLMFAAAKHGFAVLDFSAESFTVALYATSPCADQEVCPVGSGQAYSLYRAVFHRDASTQSFAKKGALS
ncbi:hypothetical protein HRbin30_01194 [bacterium HR30]|nr:hypothetical protein HRbin30_01194 [bacterium HR30]